MKKIMFLSALLLLMVSMSNFSIAQGTNNHKQGPGMAPPSEEQIEKKMNEISSELKLEGKQLKAFEKAFKENHKDMEMAHKRMREDGKEKMDALVNSFEMKMEKILDEKQFKQFKKLMPHPGKRSEHKQEKMRSHRHKQ